MDADKLGCPRCGQSIPSELTGTYMGKVKSANNIYGHRFQLDERIICICGLIMKGFAIPVVDKKKLN